MLILELGSKSRAVQKSSGLLVFRSCFQGVFHLLESPLNSHLLTMFLPLTTLSGLSLALGLDLIDFGPTTGLD